MNVGSSQKSVTEPVLIWLPIDAVHHPQSAAGSGSPFAAGGVPLSALPRRPDVYVADDVRAVSRRSTTGAGSPLAGEDGVRPRRPVVGRECQTPLIVRPTTFYVLRYY